MRGFVKKYCPDCPIGKGRGYTTEDNDTPPDQPDVQEKDRVSKDARLILDILEERDQKATYQNVAAILKEIAKKEPPAEAVKRAVSEIEIAAI
ncbi:MAG TPA: hypothetical protein PLM24_01775 [Methanothrix sp.]|nr:hypothetical protein [Methanothrix sp.]HPR65848.1 hypothetical protein [Methanothrix sp.]